jgi:tRNA(Arg) A34 adenosine deaminase TadA
MLVPGLLVLAWALMHKAYLLEPEHRLAPHEVAALAELGAAAAADLDVPVAALLVHDGTIIGRGRNTVLRDGNAGGHAEINAISDALRTLGPAGLDALDRDKLVLLTTFEPCAMCRGAILEYRLEQVGLVEPKSLRHHAGQAWRTLRYELTRMKLGPDGLQDSLFRLHPGYDPAKDRH